MQKGHAQQLINQVHLHSRQQSIALQWKKKPLYRMINTDIVHAALKADYTVMTSKLIPKLNSI